MKFEPRTERAIDRIAGVLMTQVELEEIDQKAFDAACKHIHQATPDQITRLVFQAASVKTGEAHIVTLWDMAVGDRNARPEYAVAFSRAMLNLIRLGTKKAVSEADCVS